MIPLDAQPSQPIDSSIQVQESFEPSDPMQFVDLIAEDQMYGGRPSRKDPPMPFDPVKFPLCEKEYLGPLLTVPSTTPAGAHVITLCPVAALNYLIRTYHPGFKTMRWKSIQIRLQPLSSMATLRGAMRVAYSGSFTPVGGSGLNIKYDLMRYSTIDNVVVPFSSESDTVIDIPMVYPLPWFDVTASASASTPLYPSGLYIGVDQQLGNADNAACSAQYQVFYQFKDLEFYNPTKDTITVPVHPTFTLLSSTPAYAPVSCTAYGKTEGEAVNKTQTGLISGVAETVAKASSLIATVDPTGVAAATSSVASAVGAAASFLGLDKPAALGFAEYCQLRIGDHLLQPSGLDPSLVVNVAPDVSDTTDHAIFSDTQDNGNLHSLCSKWSIHSKGTVSAAATGGTIFASTTVNPCHKLQATEGVYANNLSFWSSFFSHWRGDIRFRMTIHQDCFFKAKMFLAIAPSNVFVPPASLTTADLNLLRYSTLSLIGPNVIEFTVPYHALSDWDLTAQTTGNLPSIYFGIIEPARRQGVIAPFEWTLEVAASDEPGKYEVAEPAAWAPAFALGGISGSVSRPLGPIGQTAIVPITSITPLMKRYCYQGTIAGAAIRTLTPSLGLDPFHKLILSAFNAYRGSLRYTMYLPFDTILRGTFKNPLSAGLGTRSVAGTQCGHLVKYQDYNPEVPLEFHYLSPQYWSVISQNPTVDTHNYLEFGVYDSTGALNSTTAVVYYMSIGDDFIFGIRRPLPLLYPT